ncbi:hypothetical protein [Streptomyces sp. NBC_00582]|uniref:hypothetical protein n=1 Tax=Streptomyces sp. NBC_00582 TaxID=2975783 RepID=UPI002E81FDF0|nr:hypothetical protein [Streptomyces sp. NBC_00582]WUB68593.1 hypothetical protein OG852_50740 [Streptomyces sp. NBC_00582]
MDHTTSVRRSVAAALTSHGPDIAGAMGLAVIARIVLPFDGPVAQFIIGFVAAFIGGRLGQRVAARLSGSNS